jgi:hypothetical protein
MASMPVSIWIVGLFYTGFGLLLRYHEWGTGALRDRRKSVQEISSAMGNRQKTPEGSERMSCSQQPSTLKVGRLLCARLTSSTR